MWHGRQDYFKLGAFHAPPSIRHDAIGNEPLVEDIVILETSPPISLGK